MQIKGTLSHNKLAYWSANVIRLTDTMIVLEARDEWTSITNAANDVIESLSKECILRPQVFYRDTMGQFDMLEHDGSHFKSFTPCSRSQRDWLNQL